MISALRFACFAALGVLLAGCASNPGPEAPQAAAAAPATSATATPVPVPAPKGRAAAAVKPEEPPDEPPATPAERRQHASAQCWMKYDKSGASLEAKAKMVDKCVDDKLKTAAKP